VDAFMCYKQKCKVVSLNLAHPVDRHHCRTITSYHLITLRTSQLTWAVSLPVGC